jgi:hypothetical protein
LRCARLAWGTANAQPITLAFWSYHHRAGLYSGSVRNGATNRSYVFTYTHAAADVSQYNTVTIPGDTSGAWPFDNTTGMWLTFSLGAGATYTAPSANAWLAGSYHAAPGQVNAVAATSDVFRMTGVTIHLGSEAPSAARSPFIMRPYDQELIICKRYWQTVSLAIDFGATGYQSVGTCAFTFTPEMRATPTLSSVAVLSANISGAPVFGSGVNTSRCSNAYVYSSAASRAYYYSSAIADARL